MSHVPMPSVPSWDDEESPVGDAADSARGRAIRRIKARNEFKSHLLAYLAVNAMLVTIWAFTSGGDPRASFWPIFPMAGWGAGLLIHAYNVFWCGPITEDEIEREMRKQA